jgi:hypothetical protein
LPRGKAEPSQFYTVYQRHSHDAKQRSTSYIGGAVADGSKQYESEDVCLHSWQRRNVECGVVVEMEPKLQVRCRGDGSDECCSRWRVIEEGL